MGVKGLLRELPGGDMKDQRVGFHTLDVLRGEARHRLGGALRARGAGRHRIGSGSASRAARRVRVQRVRVRAGGGGRVLLRE